MMARCSARLDGDELVLTIANGTVHSRIPVDDTMDPAEALEHINNGTMPVRLLWSYEELDRALARDGWARVGEWHYGPAADVVRID